MKEFEQPKFQISKSDIGPNFGRFTITPLETGYGVTVGNAMRRVLLSSLPGVAVYAIEVDGARHEYTALPGVVEDLTQIVLNIKNLVLRDDSELDEGKTLKLDVTAKDEEKTIKAGDIVCPDMVSVVNKDLVICHLAKGGHIRMSLYAKKGRGFVTAEENKDSNWRLGMIAVDSNFSPIVKVNINTEPTRVGHDANYEKLVIEVTTDGSMEASDAVAWAAKILDDHFKLFEELNQAVKDATVMAISKEKPENQFNSMTLEDLDLSVRSYNCLKRNGLKTVQELCNMKESELMTVRNLGKKSYKEILDKLAGFGLSLQHDDNTKK
ncbi:DNA-directed RNA polymerase subunit alpha [Treponema rectale]|jgi:DNA-directed RNA polymerase subunit alpha|uniref:DNA-directed RNA polymerase subunit alpha n=1 Tax=Treponema rectale TaxID=744512 RepID=A0A7M1XK87_9SPIR|nr:DNA-directed RNA polymerase subunit alpha [Treponema rectale]